MIFENGPVLSGYAQEDTGDDATYERKRRYLQLDDMLNDFVWRASSCSCHLCSLNIEVRLDIAKLTELKPRETRA